MSLLLLRVDSISSAVVIRQTLAQELQAEANAAGARPVWIARVLERDRKRRAAAGGGHPDGSSLDELGDAVRNGVFDQRLQQQRRHQTPGGVGIGVARHV